MSVLVSPGRVGWWDSEFATWKVTRAPRRPAETRPFRSASGRPAVWSGAVGEVQNVEDDAAPRDAGKGTQEGAETPKGAPRWRSGRRSTATTPGQIAFDFGQ